MELLSHLADGFATSLSPLNLFIVILGVTAGLFIGAMPGLGSVNGVAIVLPMTFIVPPSSAIILLCAIYYGAMYGGAISSILLGIPGASTAVATTFDGRPMAQQGKAGLALIVAAVASFVGGTISVILFTLFAAPLADVALAFGPAEEFALVLLAFTTFVGLGGDDVLKTIIMMATGQRPAPNNLPTSALDTSYSTAHSSGTIDLNTKPTPAAATGARRTRTRGRCRARRCCVRAARSTRSCTA